MKIIPFIFLLTVWFNIQTVAQAAPYQSATVHSVYLDPTSGIWQRAKDWAFQEDGAGGISVSEGPGSGPVIILGYDSKNMVVKITKRLQRGTSSIDINESVSGPIILSSGFPVPYDQLAPFQEVNERITLKNSVAGVTFSSPATRTVRHITRQEAVTAGMLTPEAAEAITKQILTVISVLRAGKPEILQLWSDDEPFWLYEETPLRKSWRQSLTVHP